jgi:hypothetical protein
VASQQRSHDCKHPTPSHPATPNATLQEPGKKGNLVVAVDVAYPRQLTPQQKEQLKEILPAMV